MTDVQARADWMARLATELRSVAEDLAPELVELSHRIHGQPELRFEEHQAAGLLEQFLDGQGFTVSAGVADMPTAFLAEHRFGPGGPTIGIFCEYDALEDIGHACGHNIIAAAGAGAAVATARWLHTNRDVRGRILVVGSPGEEGGGGKVRLLEAGALSGMDAAVMVHPAGFDAVERPNLGRISLEVTFTGRAAHAAAAPDKGLNALDAATILLVSLGLLRQQLRADSRLHAIVLEGGAAVNVIPERSRVKVFIRSPDLSYLRGRLRSAVQACADGAALATGTGVAVTETAPAYEPMRANPVLAGLAARALAGLGRDPGANLPGSGSGGSTDMGNVSRALPAIHPYVCVAPGLTNHSREFTEAAGSATGDRAVVDGAALVGATVVALFIRPELLDQATRAFSADG